MKKGWLVLGILAAAGAGIGLLLHGRQEPPQVPVQTLALRTVEQTVSCSGVVEAGESCGVFPEAACVVSEVLVKKGQAVHAGDVLLRVDKEATRARQTTDGREAAAALALATMPDGIIAPEDGVVTAVSAAAGQWLEPGSVCVALAPRSAMQIRVAIREKNLPLLQTGQTVYVSGDGFSRSRYRGQLVSISSSARSASSGGETVVEGVVSLDRGECDDSLRLGLTAKARIVTATAEERAVIPYAAVMADDDGQEYVFLANDGTAQRRNITPEAELPEGVLLSAEESGALNGARVITRPESVTDGAVITIEGEESR